MVGGLVEDQRLVLAGQQPGPARRVSPGRRRARSVGASRSPAHAEPVQVWASPSPLLSPDGRRVPSRQGVAGSCGRKPMRAARARGARHPPRVRARRRAPQQGRLAAAIDPDDADPVPVGDRHGEIDEQWTVRSGSGEPLSVDEDGHRPSVAGPPVRSQPATKHDDSNIRIEPGQIGLTGHERQPGHLGCRDGGEVADQPIRMSHRQFSECSQRSLAARRLGCSRPTRFLGSAAGLPEL